MENRISVLSVCSCSTSGAGWIHAPLRTPERNQQEVTEATEPRKLSGFPSPFAPFAPVQLPERVEFRNRRERRSRPGNEADLTGAHRGNGDGGPNLCSLRLLG